MTYLYRFAALLLLWTLVQLTLGCATSAELPAALSQPMDSSLQHLLATRRLKIKGNVTVQIGTGNSNTDASRSRGQVATGQSRSQDYSHAGQRGGALATEAGASAGATTRTGLPPWLLAVGAVLLLVLLLLGLAYRLRRWPFG